MECNENNNFRIFILFLCLRVLMEGMKNSFSCLKIQVEGNEISGSEYSFLSISLKSQNFIPKKLEGIWGNRIRFNNFFY